MAYPFSVYEEMTKRELKVFVDFDGTIVTHEYPRIGREIPFAITTLKKLQDEFQHLLILWTVREGQELDDAVNFCRERGLEFYAINSNYPDVIPNDLQPRKLKADLFIDDRNLGGIPDWGIIYRMIKFGETLEQASAGENSTPKKKKLFGLIRTK